MTNEQLAGLLRALALQGYDLASYSDVAFEKLIRDQLEAQGPSLGLVDSEGIPLVPTPADMAGFQRLKPKPRGAPEYVQGDDRSIVQDAPAGQAQRVSTPAAAKRAGEVVAGEYTGQPDQIDLADIGAISPRVRWEDRQRDDPFGAYRTLRGKATAFDPRLMSQTDYLKTLGTGFGSKFGQFMLSPFGVDPATQIMHPNLANTFEGFLERQASGIPGLDQEALRSNFGRLAGLLQTPDPNFLWDRGIGGDELAMFAQQYLTPESSGWNQGSRLVDAVMAAAGVPRMFQRSLQQNLTNRLGTMSALSPLGDYGGVQNFVNWAAQRMGQRPNIPSVAALVAPTTEQVGEKFRPVSNAAVTNAGGGNAAVTNAAVTNAAAASAAANQQSKTVAPRMAADVAPPSMLQWGDPMASLNAANTVNLNPATQTENWLPTSVSGLPNLSEWGMYDEPDMGAQIQQAITGFPSMRKQFATAGPAVNLASQGMPQPMAGFPPVAAPAVTRFPTPQPFNSQLDEFMGGMYY